VELGVNWDSGGELGVNWDCGWSCGSTGTVYGVRGQLRLSVELGVN
jgi:hypothetical protein